MPSTIQLADFSLSVPSLMYSARIEPTGSARIISTSGACCAKHLDSPLIVPELPQPNTTASTPPTSALCRRRSDERRVGKECVRTFRHRWSPYHYKKNNVTTSQRLHAHHHRYTTHSS